MRKGFKPKTEKQVTHIDSEDDFIRRHQYCIPIRVLVGDRNQEETTARLAAKGQLKAYCDHPEDGMCGTSITPENLRKVNEKLEGRNGARVFDPIAMRQEIREKRKRGRPVGPKPLKSYFCLKCNERHEEPESQLTNGKYHAHAEFKRGRGRPKTA